MHVVPRRERERRFEYTHTHRERIVERKNTEKEGEWTNDCAVTGTLKKNTKRTLLLFTRLGNEKKNVLKSLQSQVFSPLSRTPNISDVPTTTSLAGLCQRKHLLWMKLKPILRLSCKKKEDPFPRGNKNRSS